MRTPKIKDFVRNLNSFCRTALDKSVQLAKIRDDFSIDIVHLLYQFHKSTNTDYKIIIGKFCCDETRLEHDLEKFLQHIDSGSGKMPVFSNAMIDTFKESYIASSLDDENQKVRSVHVMFALLNNTYLKQVLVNISTEYDKINPSLLHNGEAINFAESCEQKDSIRMPGELNSEKANTLDNESVVSGFTEDMTLLAKEGKYDKVIGREAEVSDLIDILLRRRKNNPILIGDAGVGKTAIVEEFAQKIVNNEVPPRLSGVRLLSIDVGGLKSGTGVRGEFEKRIKSIIDYVKKESGNTILFIDEVHTLLNAGNNSNSADASNLLKPVMARGDIKIIAATTWNEFRENIEKDVALIRRFQEINISEPSEEQAKLILQSLRTSMEAFHGVKILSEAIETAVELSVRYLPTRQLPDKAISILDTACARVALSQHTEPKSILELRNKIDLAGRKIKYLERELALHPENAEKVSLEEAAIETYKNNLADLEKEYSDQKSFGEKLKDFDLDTEHSKSSVKIYLSHLNQPGHSYMVYPFVNKKIVQDIVSNWTGVPTSNLDSAGLEKLKILRDNLELGILGQSHAIEYLIKQIKVSLANLHNPDKPIGVFMFVGPSGTGKTETALIVAESMFGSRDNIININMTEYQNSTDVNKLKGSAAGYIGYEKGGVLTEAVRRNPYSVVLLDEIEKAHGDVIELFYQIFDRGFIEDSIGNYVNFRNCIIILTSNAAQEIIEEYCEDGNNENHIPEDIEELLRKPLEEYFPDALLNRLNVIPYFPLKTEIKHKIVDKNLLKIRKRIKDQYSVEVIFDDTAKNHIINLAMKYNRGARIIESIVTNHLLPDIVDFFADGSKIRERNRTFSVKYENNGFVMSEV